MPNSSKSLVDANILLRIILRDDERLFRRAEAVIEAAAETSLVVTPVIAAEIMYVSGGRGYTRQQSTRALLYIIERPAFVRTAVLRQSLLLYAETKLDYPDCYLIARAIQKGEGLQTFDKPLQKVYARFKFDR